MDRDSWSVVKSFLVDYRNSHRVRYKSVVDTLDVVFDEYYSYRSDEYSFMTETLYDDYNDGIMSIDEFQTACSDLYDEYVEEIDVFQVMELIMDDYSGKIYSTNISTEI